MSAVLTGIFDAGHHLILPQGRSPAHIIVWSNFSYLDLFGNEMEASRLHGKKI